MICADESHSAKKVAMRSEDEKFGTGNYCVLAGGQWRWRLSQSTRLLARRHASKHVGGATSLLGLNLAPRSRRGICRGATELWSVLSIFTMLTDFFLL
jgi:hypothetical protein